MCMVDDAEPWDVVETSRPRARKEHLCGECRRTIRPGERYERTEGKADGEWQTYIVCSHCAVLGDWLIGLCRGYMFQEIREDVREHLEDGIGGLDVARAYAWQGLKWTSRRTGDLIAVPDPLVVPQRARWSA